MRSQREDAGSRRGLWLALPWGGLAVVALAMVAGLLGYTPKMWVQDALLVLLIASVFALRRDVISVALLLLLAVVADWYQLVPTPKTVYVTALLGGIALLFLVFVGERKARPWRVPRPVDLVLWGLFLLLGVAAIPRGFDIPIERKLLLITSVLYILGIFVAAFVFWLLGTLVVREPSHLRQLFSVIAALGALFAIHAIVQEVGVFLLLTPQWAHYFASPGINYYRIGGSHVRAAGLFVAPDIAESFFSSMVFLPLGLLVTSRTWAARALYAGEIVVILLANLFTFGPVGWAAVALGIVLFAALALHGRTRLVFLGALAAVVVCALALLPRELHVLVAHATGKSELGLRVGIWITALHAIAAHPLLGVGLGQGPAYELRVQAYKVASLPHVFPHPQNSFLEFAAFAGIPVLLIFLAILVRGFVFSVRTYRLADAALQPVIAGGLATLLALCVNAFSDITFTATVLVPFCYVLLGALSSPRLAASFRRAEPGTERALYPVRFGPVTQPTATSLTSARRAFPLNLDPTRMLPLAVAVDRSDEGNGGGTQALATAHDALSAWNEYLRTGDQRLAERVLSGATVLADTMVVLPGDCGGWLVTASRSRVAESEGWLSAGVQALALATLRRGYALSGDLRLRDAAERVRATFLLDILDGGVQAPAGDSGVVFQGKATYPATHHLADFLLALLCLYDDQSARTLEVEPAIGEAHQTLHSLLSAYDRRVTTRRDLFSDAVPTASELTCHAILLDAFADTAGCSTCAAQARSWKARASSPSARLAVVTMRLRARVVAIPVSIARHILFSRSASAPVSRERSARVCVPITAYPVAGGMRAVLGGWRQAMDGIWQMEFLTRHIGPGGEGQIIRSFELKIRPFGRETSTPSQFPNIWFYVYAGYHGLRRTLRRFPGYTCILPQDGVWTAAFAAVVGRMTGVRVVTVDHGNIFDLFDDGFRREATGLLRRFSLPKRLLARLRLVFYWPSVRLLARIGTRNSTAFLTASDDISDRYRERLGVPAYKISRFPFMIDTVRYSSVEDSQRVNLRAGYGLNDDAIVIAMVNRLHPMKGLDAALPALQQMMDGLPEALRARVRVLVAGDGPLRAQVEREIGERGLADVVRLLGEASPDEVIDVLRASDIFLFTAVRSINSMAVLEAMATGCAAVATESTRHIAEYLADGGGIAVPVRDITGLTQGLVALVSDDRRRESARTRARNYVVQHHTAEAVRRVLLRATGYTPTWGVTAVTRSAQPAYIGRE